MAPTSLTASVKPAALLLRLDKLGVVIALMVMAGSWLLPFVISRPNRIVLGEPLAISGALPASHALLLYALLTLGVVVAVLKVPGPWRLVCGLLVTATLSLMLGAAATFLTPDGNSVARVSPAGGFWVCLFAFALLIADALARMRPGPAARLAILSLIIAASAAMLWTGVWGDVSILREYANRGAAFWAEARTHVFLAFGALAAACVVGLPLGIVCYRNQRLRAGVLNGLNIVQTIPSIALFGLLIAPLAWVAANVPGASALGVSGIGFAPAILALFFYSLLPIVANTLAGLEAAPETVKEAARGMGMTDRQILLQAELPLALPIILTGIRIVLVQNIGLATIAALIGGGGFGVFVFQGIGQTAMDLVLLGAVPTVALAIASAVALDAMIDLASPGRVRAT